MNTSEQVTVYYFRWLHSGYESAPMSNFKATRQAIVEDFGGDPIDATAERVRASALDEQGRYRRLATGWGALG